MSSWLDSSDNANCFKQTYVQGFVDISGGSIITRGPNDGIVIGGDSSLNGTVYLGDSMFVRSDGLVAPGDASNGATAIYVDASYAGQPGVVGVVKPDISGNAANDATVLSSYLASDASWSQLGFDIDGEAEGDQSGQSVSLINSATYGRVVAIGANQNDGNGADAGHVRVYQHRAITETSWTNYNIADTSYNGISPYDKPIVIGASGDVNPVPGKKYWVQLGADIDGEAGSDRSGQSVSLVDSANGLVVAIGAFFNGGNGGYAGHVRVYQYRQYTSADANKYHHTSQLQNTTQTKPLIITAANDTAPVAGTYYWTQTGFDINGEASSDNSGQSVSLVDASGGLVVAIGANQNNGTPDSADCGHVRVYQYRQYTSADVNKYHHTSRTSTTLPLIITAANDTAPVAGTYYWTQTGFDINGEASSDNSGQSVSLVDSANGLVVAIGAYNNDAGNGHVRVYQYREYTLADANKYHHTDRLQNTTTQTKPLIITAAINIAPVAGTYYWTQTGFDIDNEAGGDKSGYSVSLVDSAGGIVVAIGAYANDSNGNDAGHCRVYQYRQYTSADANKYYHTSRLQNTTQLLPLIITADNTAPQDGTYYWTQIGFDIDGEAASDQSGRSVSLVDSANGPVVAIGAFQNDGNGANAGHVRVYQYRQYTSADANKYHHTSRLQNTTTPQLLPLIITAANNTAPQYGTYYWTQTSFDIDGELGGDNSGYSVSLADSANGLVVAIGANKNDAGNATSDNRGHVRVYEIPYTKVYSDVSGGYYDVSVIDGYLNDGKTAAALYVNGDTDLSGGLTVSGDVSFNTGNLFVAGDLSLNGNLFVNSFAANSINADAIDSTVDIEFANKLSVSTSDLSFNKTALKVATNFNSNNTLATLAANLTVPANIAIVDGSNGTVYGSYLTLTNKAATAYYNVGKSASGLFNIVDQANAGVYLASGGTSFTGTSDARLKTNIAPLESATDKIMALNPCTYQWKSDVESTETDHNNTITTKTHIGFIAQEVEKIMPELVHPIDHPAGSDYKGVNTTDLIPYLVRMIQENQQCIDSLRTEIRALSA
jgi:hypothetical protein